MSYTDVFGGNLIFPSRVSYLALTTAIDVQLQWATEQQITGQNVVADIIDVDATAPGLRIDMPDARNASTGNKVTFNNIGANGYLVRDITGGTIQTVQPGEQWVLTLTDNSTDMGTWTTFQLGASVAVASASALAGAGIKAIGVLLNQKIDSDVQGATPFTLVEGDRASCQIYTAGAGVGNLPSAGVVGNDWFVMIRNSGSGTLTITPMAGTIDGSPTVNLDPNGSTFVFTDGVNWFTIGLTVASTIAFDFVSLPVPGSGDFVLSGANLNRIAYRFTGALTGNRRIVVPNTTQQYWVDNQTSGAFTLSISTAGQAGPPTIGQGDTVIFYCDATDVINAVNTAAIALPVLIAQGGTSATTAPNALLNLGAAASALLLNTNVDSGLMGGGDLTADRTLILDVNNLDDTPSPALGDFIAFEDIDDNITYKTTLTDLFALNPSGITIEDEGTPLATVADTLDFVGGGVVASGVGSTKTITISGDVTFPIQALDNDQIQWGTLNRVQQLFDGTSMRFEGDWPFVLVSPFANSHEIKILNSGDGISLGVDAGGDGQINQLTSAGLFVRTYIDFNTIAGQVLLGYGNVPVARTAPVSGAAYPYIDTTGGFLVNNNTTGSGNNERVLTFVDHSMTGGLADNRNLTTVMTADSRLVTGSLRRQGYVKFEIYCSFSKVGGTSQIEFDFAGSNLIECTYIYDYRTADGTPSGAGASDTAAANQSLPLGSAGERTHLRISGYARFNNFSSTFEFRWRPTVSQVDTVSRNAGGWMTICPVLIE